MENYVNIMLGSGFKAVFGQKQVAIDFINATLEGERQVRDLIYLDKEILPESIDQRTVIFDCLCEDVDGSTPGVRTWYWRMQVYISFELFNLRKEECVTSLEKLVFILKNMNIFDMAPFKEENEAFRRILDAANVNAMTPHERDVYDELLKRYRDWRCTTEYAIEQAEEKGLARGMEKGLAKGMEQGLAKGKAEEQREIAANFKKQGIGIDTIALCTGLPIEEIERL